MTVLGCGGWFSKNGLRGWRGENPKGSIEKNTRDSVFCSYKSDLLKEGRAKAIYR
jgi:hypothetical protein